MIRYGDSCRMAVLYIYCTLEGLKCQEVTVTFSTMASVNATARSISEVIHHSSSS